uniref:Uncharacterized protein n=1 Tax=Caenorhabditis japonica TaxID=281687 RepID=A0A8R1E7X4_CAEJA
MGQPVYRVYQQRVEVQAIGTHTQRMANEVALAFNLATRLIQQSNTYSHASTRSLPALRTEPQTTSIIHHTRSSGYQNSRLPNYRQHIRNLENQAIRTLRTKPNTSSTWTMPKRWSSEAIGCSP